MHLSASAKGFMMMRPASLLACAAMICSPGASAGEQEPLRPVTVSYMAGGGTAHVTDAYLAPFSTTGWGTAFIYERSQALKSRPDTWSRLLSVELSLSRTHRNNTSNGTMWGAAVDVEAAALRRFGQLPCGLRLAVGPSAELLAGAYYRPSNSNNPAAARAALTVGVTGRAALGVNLFGLPVDLSYRPSLQLLGAFFAPSYGQLYYEIYEGDSGNLCRFAWPGKRLSYSHLLAADLCFGATQLRLGYSLRLLTQEASHLSVNAATHLFVIGITTDFMTLNRRRDADSGIARRIAYSF
ncbi:MAG: DUF3316 domain-containing protein [Candidatus Amulumruptor sp.]|nr:DUF3316 domain-containing protein [Candidatus Amulumruptor sp.]